MPLCDARAYDEGLLGQQLGLRKAMLAFVLLLPATCWERPALAAVLVLLVVMVLHSGLIVLQHLVELFGIVVRTCRQVVHAAIFRPDVGFLSVLPYALRYVAELLVVFEGGPLLLDGVCLPLVLVGVRVRFTADPRRVLFELLAAEKLLLDELGDLLYRVVPNNRLLWVPVIPCLF